MKERKGTTAVAERDTIYIAGPMTNVPEWNFPAFNMAAACFRAEGHTVINPAELDANAGDVGKHPWDFYLRRDLKVLSDCTRIVMLPGWRDSKGARLEHHVAAELGMTITYLEGA